jgi:hypothetical protein
MDIVAQFLASATTLAGRFLKEEVSIRPGALANLVQELRSRSYPLQCWQDRL